MAATAQSAPQDKVSAAQPKLRLRYGRLSLALIALLALLATVVTGILAPFTAISFGLVLACFVVGVLGIAALRVLAVNDRNRKLLQHLEKTRQAATQTPAFADASNQVIAAKAANEKVFDARPGSGKRAPSITAEELRAEAVRVARGDGGVKSPATWKPTEVPKPKYVAVREATEAAAKESAAKVRPTPQPLPTAEPLRPTAQISLKAAEESKKIARQVSAADQAAIAKLDTARKDPEVAEPKPAAENADPANPVLPEATETVAEQESTVAQTPATPAENNAETNKPRLNLDAVMQRRRA